VTYFLVVNAIIMRNVGYKVDTLETVKDRNVIPSVLKLISGGL